MRWDSDQHNNISWGHCDGKIEGKLTTIFGKNPAQAAQHHVLPGQLILGSITHCLQACCALGWVPYQAELDRAGSSTPQYIKEAPAEMCTFATLLCEGCWAGRCQQPEMDENRTVMEGHRSHDKPVSEQMKL